MTIRKITNKQDTDKFIYLCKYCFPNMGGWIDRQLPLAEDDILWGNFQGEELQAGLIAKSFDSWLYNTKLKMSGISAVVSAPEKRNSGHVRDLIKHALNHDLKRGLLFSSLSPFLFQFYENLGYAFIGGPKLYIFKPEDIRRFSINGEFIPVTSPALSGKLIDVHAQFVSKYEFGISFQHEAENYHVYLKDTDTYAYIYVHEKKARGYLEYKLFPGEGFSKKMNVTRLCFLDVDSLQALFAFIKSHRNNCSEVMLSVPENLELRHMFLEPRVKIESISNWMGRPLDIEAILKLRLNNDPCDDEIIFSIHDTIIEKNSGTYRLKGAEFTKEADKNIKTIPLNTFSSLLFNSCSFNEAYTAGRIDWRDNFIAEYFSKKRPVYISETF
ncbi:MAG: GNAT family N-acetyltransferase [Spirochaetes bacterium]|nr:GNAT family N-acetyltransferase [Spirochaetota bacterium]